MKIFKSNPHFVFVSVVVAFASAAPAFSDNASAVSQAVNFFRKDFTLSLAAARYFALTADNQPGGGATSLAAPALGGEAATVCALVHED